MIRLFILILKRAGKNVPREQLVFYFTTRQIMTIEKERREVKTQRAALDEQKRLLASDKERMEFKIDQVPTFFYSIGHIYFRIILIDVLDLYANSNVVLTSGANRIAVKS